MAKLPIEVFCVTSHKEEITLAIELLNRIQDQFHFCRLRPINTIDIELLIDDQIHTSTFLDGVERFRQKERGFHPFVVTVVDSHLTGKRLTNLFGQGRVKSGIAVLTTDSVDGIVLPRNSLVAYFTYYLSRYALGFAAPSHRNHDEARACVYDRKLLKTDIIKSMKARSLCSECRESLFNSTTPLSSAQFDALNIMFTASGNLIDDPGYKKALQYGRSPQPSSNFQPLSYFLSYSWGDTEIADHIELLLARKGRTVFRDESRSNPGTDLSKHLKFLITSADVFLALHSENYVNSDWCPHELTYGLQCINQKEKPQKIVVLELDDTEVPLRLLKDLRLQARTRDARELAILNIINAEQGIASER